MNVRTLVSLALLLTVAQPLASRGVSAAPAAPVHPAGSTPAINGAGVGETNECLTCHRKEKEKRLSEPTRHFLDDIHYRKGLGCVGCHGGDPKDNDITGMDPDKGFVGKPKHSEIAALCAKCHTNAAYMKRFNPQPYIFSMAEFQTSVHFKKAALGDTKVATCTSCHGVHGIRTHKDPASPVYHTNVPHTCGQCHNPEYMKGRSIPTDQYTKYKDSVHGKAVLEHGDMSAPACNNCHGNHGAVPPNTSDISRVCSNCHGREGELFESSKVKETLALEGKRGCVTCHGNHGVRKPTDAMIGLDPSRGGVCGSCHAKGSAGQVAAEQFVPAFHGLKARISEADSVLGRAERLGMPTEKGRELLRQAGDQVVGLRSTLHGFNFSQDSASAAEGKTAADKALDAARGALKDWRTRRIGMGLSLIAILFAIGLLLLKIRQVEEDSRSGVK